MTSKYSLNSVTYLVIRKQGSTFHKVGTLPIKVVRIIITFIRGIPANNKSLIIAK